MAWHGLYGKTGPTAHLGQETDGLGVGGPVSGGDGGDHRGGLLLHPRRQRAVLVGVQGPQHVPQHGVGAVRGPDVRRLILGEATLASLHLDQEERGGGAK